MYCIIVFFRFTRCLYEDRNKKYFYVNYYRTIIALCNITIIKIDLFRLMDLRFEYRNIFRNNNILLMSKIIIRNSFSIFLLLFKK